MRGISVSCSFSSVRNCILFFFFFQAEDGIRDLTVTGFRRVLFRSWLWFVILGVALIILGCIALGSVVAASLATAIVIGALMLVGGGGREHRRLLVPGLERLLLRSEERRVGKVGVFRWSGWGGGRGR